MTLMMNELGEFYRPEDFEPPRNPFAKYAKVPASKLDDEPVRARAKPSKVYDKKCDICHEPFSTGHKNQKYCSDECRREANRRNNAKRRRGAKRAIAASSLTVILALIFPLAASADEPLEVMDLPMRVEMVGGRMAHGAGAAFARESAPEPISDGVGDSGGYFVESAQTEPQIGSESPGADTGGYYGYVAEYNELYNEDGPSHEMPGWHEGYLETYYSDTVMRHYMSDQWTVDSEGFYRDGDYYIVGVDINDTNPNTGQPYQIGDVVETGRGEALVMDYGSGARVHDFYVHGW